MLKGENEKIASRLKEARGMRGVSQKALAEMCGWTQSRIGNYESGIRCIGVSDAIILSKFLGMAPAELMFGKDDSMSLCNDEKKLLHIFRQLPKPDQKQMLRVFSRRLKEIDEYVEKYLKGRHPR
ncbi:helix-turn-helix protein [Raoultella sp. BIGb0138]|uniref:helix-turn-helix domain-containing protein n=1 Tax=Raoultella sp. BIGb0138 TaxID=2485115 RepID=UPI001053C722|nr:helix-turn-helix domain-containing protein [Raoultella sp. BIGb0138]TCW16284.1 helix-turn-helix protein [Raoultella sp. BIGb0138]